MTKITQADHAQIILRRAGRESLKSIANDFGISVGYVSQICGEAGLQGIVADAQPPAPPGHRRLVSGKVIKYTPTAEWLAQQVGTRPKDER